MELWEIIILILGLYLLLMTIFSLFVRAFVNKSIGKRADKNELLTYFSSQDYQGLNVREFSFKNNQDVTLQAREYYYEKNSDTIAIFFHGFGSGHMAYTTLINDLASSLKMSVLTFDYMGCDLSEGDKIPNTLQAVVDAKSFIEYISTIEEYKDKKLVLIGHSWGGFVATNLAPLFQEHKIIRVISLNGVTDFSLMYKVMSRAPSLFIPLNNFLNSFRYKKIAYMTTRKSIKNTKIPTLIMYGEKDDAVPLNPFVSLLVLPSKDNKNIMFYGDKNKFHNIYLTLESETKLRELQSDLKEITKKNNNEDIIAKIKNTDFHELVVNDPAVISVISTFIKDGRV